MTVDRNPISRVINERADSAEELLVIDIVVGIVVGIVGGIVVGIVVVRTEAHAVNNISN